MEFGVHTETSRERFQGLVLGLGAQESQGA